MHVGTSGAATTIFPLKHGTRFCTAPDGVRLAYAIEGEGPPLVKAGNWMTHLDYERHSPVWRHWVRELSHRLTLIRYDERGCGLSDRQFDATPTLDTYVGDLAAVVDAVDLERFALLGVSGGGPTAIEYAARDPERVSRLVLYGTYARAIDAASVRASSRGCSSTSCAWARVARCPRSGRCSALIYIPSAGEDKKRWYDEMQQASSTGDMAARLWLSRTETDISDTTRRVTQPALVLHARQDRAVPYEEGRRLAALLPDARFMTLASDNGRGLVEALERHGRRERRGLRPTPLCGRVVHAAGHLHADGSRPAGEPALRKPALAVDQAELVVGLVLACFVVRRRPKPTVEHASELQRASAPADAHGDRKRSLRAAVARLGALRRRAAGRRALLEASREGPIRGHHSAAEVAEAPPPSGPRVRARQPPERQPGRPPRRERNGLAAAPHNSAAALQTLPRAAPGGGLLARDGQHREAQVARLGVHRRRKPERQQQTDDQHAREA
jgi:pimeloyl-ACP methyl ester carboxylesterase